VEFVEFYGKMLVIMTQNLEGGAAIHQLQVYRGSSPNFASHCYDVNL
jgi:hypothetical protein